VPALTWETARREPTAGGDSAADEVYAPVAMLLLQDRSWEPPGEEEPPRPARRWHLPWRPLAWFAVWCWLMAIVPIVGKAFGNLAAYGVLLVAIALVL
jgi:hypothetical protein